MAPPHQVCITGTGVIAPLGVCPAAMWKALLGGQSAVGPVKRFDAGRFSSRLAAEIVDTDLSFDDSPYAHEARRMDRFVQYALAAARSAFADSGIVSRGECPPDGGVYIGVGTGGLPHL